MMVMRRLTWLFLALSGCFVDAFSPDTGGAPSGGGPSAGAPGVGGAGAGTAGAPEGGAGGTGGAVAGGAPSTGGAGAGGAATGGSGAGGGPGVTCSALVFDGVDDVATVTGLGSFLQDGFTLRAHGRSTDTSNHKSYLAGSGLSVFIALAKTGSNRKVIGHVGSCSDLEVVVGDGMLEIELRYDPSREEVALVVSEDGSNVPEQLQPCVSPNLLGLVSTWSAGDSIVLPGGTSKLEGELTYLRVDAGTGCVGGDVSTATTAADQTIVLSGCGESLVRGLTPLSGSDDPTLVCAP
jgi:hypothetical protein